MSDKEERFEQVINTFMIVAWDAMNSGFSKKQIRAALNTAVDALNHSFADKKNKQSQKTLCLRK